MFSKHLLGLPGVLLIQGTALAGSVITDNLPPGLAIVNVDARADGAASFNGDQSLWYHPFNQSGGPLPELTVPAGNYAFRVINPADAAALFPSLTQAQTNQIFTAWTYNVPWILDYLVFDGAAATNSSIPQLFDGDPEWPPAGNAADAYKASMTHGTYNQIRVGPLGRDSTDLVTSYFLPAQTSLIFVVPDYGLGDNGGGVSVLVSPAQPNLLVHAQESAINIDWPTNGATGYGLEATAQLNNATWNPIDLKPTVQGQYYSVVLPIEPGSRFFRLRK